MTEPLTQNRVDIKAILADPLLREELIEGATDFICKVEGIRRTPQAQAVLDAAFSAYWSAEQEAPNDEGMIAAALRAAAIDQNKQIDVPFLKLINGKRLKEAHCLTGQRLSGDTKRL